MLTGAAVVRTRAPESEKMSVDIYNAALTGQVQALITKHDRAGPTSAARATLCLKTQDFSSKKCLRRGLHCTQEVRISFTSLPALESTSHQLLALSPVVLLRTPSCILSRMPRSLSR